MITRRSMLRGAFAAMILPLPTSPPILTIEGKITMFNADHTAQFDRAMLENLGMTSFITSTPWFDGLTKFDGVLMRTLMDAIGAFGDTMIATALDDYVTSAPVSDFHQYDVLLALKRNDKYMPVKDKGPLFLVYPFDSNPVLNSQRYYGRSEWQLTRMRLA